MSHTKGFSAGDFNGEAFSAVVAGTKELKIKQLQKAGVFAPAPEIKDTFSVGSTTGFAYVAMRGDLSGDADNYDGETDILAPESEHYEQGVVAVGRAKAWTQRDFVYDSNVPDFMDGVARQVALYKDDLDIKTLIATLEGIFACDTAFAASHTLNITSETEPAVSAATLNRAIHKACGEGRRKFTAVLLHSDVAATLENLNLLEFMQYTDKEGITRDLSLGTWNGKVVVISDRLPAVHGEDEDENEIITYTSYVLGEGAFSVEDVGVKVPYEVVRDPRARGGEDTLFMRQRKVFAPYGFSYLKAAQSTASPTDAELADPDNWTVAKYGSVAFERGFIPIARIVSLG